LVRSERLSLRPTVVRVPSAGPRVCAGPLDPHRRRGRWSAASPRRSRAMVRSRPTGCARRCGRRSLSWQAIGAQMWAQSRRSPSAARPRHHANQYCHQQICQSSTAFLNGRIAARAI